MARLAPAAFSALPLLAAPWRKRPGDRARTVFVALVAALHAIFLALARA
jgi:hypothetical protein